MRIFLFSFVFLLAACAAQVSQNEVNVLNRQCFQQFAMSSQMGDMQRWSKWAQCKKTYMMPVEIKNFDVTEADLAPIYDALIADYTDFEKTVGSASKAQEQKALDKIHNVYEQRKADLGLKKCIMWEEIGGGTKKCQMWK